MAEKPEDLNLPTSVITRIIKEAIPEGVNVSKDAKTAISRAASVFVLYATACANTHAMKSKRKTILPSDLFQALGDMELEEFIPELKESLEVYKKDQKVKKQAAADRKKKLQTEVNPETESGDNETLNSQAEMECETMETSPIISDNASPFPVNETSSSSIVNSTLSTAPAVLSS